MKQNARPKTSEENMVQALTSFSCQNLRQWPLHWNHFVANCSTLPFVSRVCMWSHTVGFLTVATVSECPSWFVQWLAYEVVKILM